MKHTKLPWKIEGGRCISGDGKDIAQLDASDRGFTTMPTVEEAEENAKYIVICCNNFQRMINSLDSAVKVIDLLLEESNFTPEQKKDAKRKTYRIKRTISGFDL